MSLDNCNVQLYFCKIFQTLQTNKSVVLLQQKKAVRNKVYAVIVISGGAKKNRTVFKLLYF